MIDRHLSPPGVKLIFIADRGFHSLNVFAHAIEHDSYFLVRATDIKIQRLLASDIPLEDYFDIQINCILTRTNSKKKRIHPKLSDQYKYVCKDVAFDYIDSEKQTEYPIALRVLRFQVSETGYENIIKTCLLTDFRLTKSKASIISDGH
jgi:hypothetical protein